MDPGYGQLKDWVLDHTGLHYYADRDEDLAARILRRMGARQIRDCTSYRAMLAEGAGQRAELDSLVGELTIGETYFFRQPEQFDLLRTRIIPELLKRNAESRRIRIWSAGCATGAEPYSVALLLRLEFGAALKGWDVSILGTDINVDFIEQARTGVFGSWALREVPEALRQTCFEARDRRWQLRAKYRENVSFEYANLAGQLPFPGAVGDPLDLVLCRNVLIYFSLERMMEIAARLYASLSDGGWLLVGHAEANTAVFSRYVVDGDAGGAVYRRLPRVNSVGLQRPPSDSPPKLPSLAGRSERTIHGRIPAPVFRSARSAPPNRALGTAEDARLLADCGQFERAGEICRQLVENDPLNAHAYFTLGLIFEHTSSPREAESAFRRAIYLDRGLVLAHYHCGASLQSAGNVVSARKFFENVIGMLDAVATDERVPEGDGMTAGELRGLARMHLERIAAGRKAD